jgi:O-Antigen ligase
LDGSPNIRVMPALARVTLVALVVYTGLQVSMGGTLDESVRAHAGPIDVYLFDVLLFAAVMLQLHEVVTKRSHGIPASNRVVVLLVFGYCAYQLAIVLPVSVVFHDLAPIGVLRELEVRLALALLPFVYLVVLKYISPQRVILLVNLAAVAVALYAAYTYASTGPDVLVGKFRQVDGHASFLFAFLILTSLFLQRPSIITYAAAMIGMVGLAFANHRSAYLALLAVGIPLFFYFRHASTRTVVVLMVVISSAVFVVSANPTVRESVYYSLRTMVNPNADLNTRNRGDRSKLGWEYFVANPLGDHAWNQRYYLVDLPEPFEPHNFVIQILGQQGIIGFAFFAGIIVTVVRIAWRNRSADRLSTVMLAFFVFYLLFSLFNTTIISLENILLLAVPVGIILKRNADLPGESGEQASKEGGLTASASLSGTHATCCAWLAAAMLPVTRKFHYWARTPDRLRVGLAGHESVTFARGRARADARSRRSWRAARFPAASSLKFSQDARATPTGTNVVLSKACGHSTGDPTAWFVAR